MATEFFQSVFLAHLRRIVRESKTIDASRHWPDTGHSRDVENGPPQPKLDFFGHREITVVSTNARNRKFLSTTEGVRVDDEERETIVEKGV